MAIELIDAFAEQTWTGLAELDTAGRATQRQARQAVYEYVDEVREDAKACGVNPVTDPAWNVARAAGSDQRARAPRLYVSGWLVPRASGTVRVRTVLPRVPLRYSALAQC